MGHNLWLHFGVAEHPFATYFDVHHKYRVLTHIDIYGPFICPGSTPLTICSTSRTAHSFPRNRQGLRILASGAM